MPVPLVHWLFLDLNSYFASVEQHEQPHLRGRPVAVVPVMADTTCCIAASYEAKAFGVRTGTQVAEARRLCPGIVLVEARHELYVDIHNRIVKAVESCIPVTSVMSIDEMACQLMGRECQLPAALALGEKIKVHIRSRVGDSLRCSVGLAPNRYLAKIASDMEKPDGLVALTPDILSSALATLKLRDLPGVGARMEKRLNQAGVHSMPQMLSLSREQMGEAWGSVGGERMWHWLRGEDFCLDDAGPAKSVGHSHVLSPELRTPEGAWAVAQKLLHKAAMRLRSKNLWASHLSALVRFAVPIEQAKSRHYSGIPQQKWTDSLSLVECQDNLTMHEGLRTLWARQPQSPLNAKPFFVGVQLSRLVPDHLHTLSLFDDLEAQQQRKRLTTTMDAINHRFGTHMVGPASMLPARTAAPTRIAFTSIPELF